MDLLIFGAGVRAAAWSALRAGVNPICADLFADLDLVARCPARRIEPSGYPDDFLGVARQIPSTPWIYTGALENRPELISAISGRHRLLGNSPETLRAVRDPTILHEVVRASGLDAPRVTLRPDGLPQDGSWLVKPLASGAGHGIQPWSGQGLPKRPCYFQERIEGTSIAAIYVAGRGECSYLGVTRQFVGHAGNRFAYRGSLGPWPIGDEAERRLEALGRVIAPAFGLAGLFGIDLVEREGKVWPIEVNPRYSSSIEILEWTQGRSFMAEHLRACGEQGTRPRWSGGKVMPFAAKAILHANRGCVWPWIEPDLMPGLWEFPKIADIPHEGTRFRAGQPVVTVFAQGATKGACLRELGSQLREWRSRLNGVRPGC